MGTSWISRKGGILEKRGVDLEKGGYERPYKLYAMIHPFSDYTCPVWYPSIRKDLQKRLQVSQNNCVRFCLQLYKKTRIGVAELKKLTG